MNDQLNERQMWEMVATWDQSLTFEPAMDAKLVRKKLTASKFSRNALFHHMAQGRTYIAAGLQIEIGSKGAKAKREEVLIKTISSAFNQEQKARVQRGPSKTRSRMIVADLIERWQHRRGIISTTDLHFRGTSVEKQIDVEPLSDFNLLPKFEGSVNSLEKMTLVIGSAGNITDSHTDDCDGSNHCIAGSKLWLVWDRLEGQKSGLQDCTHDYVCDQAAFDMATFLSLKSSQWFKICAGDTLFLPGHLAHKVVTLERYLGFGSFYLTFCNLFGSLKRWLVDEPSDVTAHMIQIITEGVRYWMTSRDRSSVLLRRKAGADFFQLAKEYWMATETKRVKQRLMKESAFSELMELK